MLPFRRRRLAPDVICQFVDRVLIIVENEIGGGYNVTMWD